MSWLTISIISLLLLTASLVAHVATGWYMVNLLKQIKYYDEELTENITVINNFTNHLKSVYELETFYGDETLRHLLKHAEDLTSVFDQYQLYSDDDVTEEELINDDQTESQATAQETKAN